MFVLIWQSNRRIFTRKCWINFNLIFPVKYRISDFCFEIIGHVTKRFVLIGQSEKRARFFYVMSKASPTRKLILIGQNSILLSCLHFWKIQTEFQFLKKQKTRESTTATVQFTYWQLWFDRIFHNFVISEILWIRRGIVKVELIWKTNIKSHCSKPTFMS